MRSTAHADNVQQGEVETRLELVRRRLRGHGGGIELDSVATGGVVYLRFTGMCVGCLLKPLTMAAVVRPALLDLQGVAEIVVSGARVSTVSEERLQLVLAARTDHTHKSSAADRARRGSVDPNVARVRGALNH